MYSRSVWAAAAAIVLLPAWASDAQPEAAPVRPDPLDAKAEVSPLTYTSTLGRYRAAGEVEVGSWREANDTVTRIGGWRAYTREASQPEATPAAEPAAPTSAPVPGDAGHRHHGQR